MNKNIISFGIVFLLASPTLFGINNRFNQDNWQERQRRAFDNGLRASGNAALLAPMDGAHGSSINAHVEGDNEEKATKRNDLIVFGKSLALSTCVAGTVMATIYSIDGPSSAIGLLCSSWLASKVSISLNNSMDVPQPERHYRSKQWDGVVLGTALSALACSYMYFGSKSA